MENSEESKIVEEDVMLKVFDYDVESAHPGFNMPIWWGDDQSHVQDEINVDDFIGWMFETGRIDNYHTEGEGLIEIGDDYHEYSRMSNEFICNKKGTFHYTFRQFIRDCVTSNDFVTYKTCLS